MAQTDNHEPPVIPAPEETYALVGQEEAEAELLAALRSVRMHHAWLMTGPRGVGKATLAFRFARFLLRHGHDAAALSSARSLAVAADDAISRRMAAGAVQDLFVLRRRLDEKTGKLKTVIDVDQVRQLQNFLALAAGGLSWRVAIIDAADDLNRNAANALLKALEEPPRRAVLLLVAHASGRILPTIRSRCRKLALKPLAPDVIRAELAERCTALGLPPVLATDEALIARLAGGSLGRAFELHVAGGLAQHRAVERVLQSWPRLSEGDLQELLSAALARQPEGAFDRLAERIIACVHAAARAGASEPAGERALDMAHLAAGAPAWMWADLAGELAELFASARAIHLDERAVIAEALRRIANLGPAQAA